MIDAFVIRNKRFIALVIAAVLVMLGVLSEPVRRAEAQADNGTAYATMSSVVKKTELTMDKSGYTFSNSSDGMFRLSYAEDESYLIGNSEDSDTKITYSLIRYGKKLYLVVSDDSDDNSEYNGSYTDTSFEMLESKNYDSAKRRVSMKLTDGGSVSLTAFVYASDYSVKVTGSIDGIFYVDGQKADGLYVDGSDTYYYDAGVMVKNAFRSVGKTFYYFGSDGKAVKSQWRTSRNVDYYLSADGSAVRRFFRSNYSKSEYAGRLYSFAGGRWKCSATGVKVINGSIYYFENGKLTTATKWYKSSNNWIYYMSAGDVKYKMAASGNTYKCYVLGNGGTWSAASSMWLPSYEGCAIHTNEKGVADKLFYKPGYSDKSLAGTFQVYSGGKWVKKKNAVLNVSGVYYYFNTSGRIVLSKGWKTINDKCAAYVSDKGYVTGYVSYNSATGKTKYKKGRLLNVTTAGLKKVMLNGKLVYYYSDAKGICTQSDRVTVDGTGYVFDMYGRGTKSAGMSWSYDTWMKRVLKKYFGTTGIQCNEFVAQALRYAGGSDASAEMALKYTSYSKGGIVINSSNSCSYWATGSITANAVVSDGTEWLDSKEYVITSDRENFSYSALRPGDVIVYYTDGSPTHVGIFFGKYDTVDELKAYLKKLGVSTEKCEEYVHTWGTVYGNKSNYWVLQGGMGGDNEVYISNTADDLAGQTAKKIIHIRQ